MKKYTKPILELSSEITEGVYLASGDQQDEIKAICRFGRKDANQGADMCQTCSATGGLRSEPLEGERHYRDDFKGCPDNMPQKEA